MVDRIVSDQPEPVDLGALQLKELFPTLDLDHAALHLDLLKQDYHLLTASEDEFNLDLTDSLADLGERSHIQAAPFCGGH